METQTYKTAGVQTGIREKGCPLPAPGYYGYKEEWQKTQTSRLPI